MVPGNSLKNWPNCGATWNNNQKYTEVGIGQDNRVTCAYTKTNEKIEFDNIICNADPPMVYKHLLKLIRNNPWDLKVVSISIDKFMVFMCFFGTTIKYEKVAHHTIWLTERFEELLSIFDRKTLTEDFSIHT